MARPKSADPANSREQKRLADVERSRERTRKGSDIGDIPPVKDAARRGACKNNLLLFLTTYFPYSTGLSPFSEDHKRVIGRIEDCILRGGRFCNAVYRGFAKSTISENALLWAILYGHRKFGAIFAAEAGLADKAINSIKTELSDNDLLYDDFPEVCHAVHALEGKVQRCGSQTHGGKRTHIEWKKDTIVMPTIAGSIASGSIITSKGLAGSILGLRHKNPDGRQLRPDVVIVDDPQTRESARSPGQCQTRMEILTKSVMKLAGHSTSMACVVNATVIEHGDMVDQLLDAGKHPAWQGERIPMVRKWAERHEDMWLEQYATLRRTFAKDIVGDQARAHREANDFYLANRAAMDAGCQVSWESCFDPERENSAIQHAYNAYLDDGPAVFASEFQQEPIRNEADASGISAEEVRGRAIHVPRWLVPRGLDTLTAFVDVQKELLYWAVVAWGHQFRGHVVAYGTYPDQGRSYFTLRDAKKTLSRAHGNNVEAAIHAGLEAVAAELLDREFARENDDAVLRIGQMFIDANWAQTQGVIRDFARRSSYGPRVLPTHGRYVGASGQTISDKKPDKGERVGANWRTSTIGRQRHVLFDTNSWKTFLVARMKLPVGDPQAFTVHDGVVHDMLADQLASEVPVRVESKMRQCDEWKLVPGRDNHLLDCVVGAAVAASYAGISAVGAEAKPAAPRKVITREDLAARRAALLAKMGR
jgi:hypothetical protein